MDNFTYQKDELNLELEKYEWDNVWWEQPCNHTKLRVLYIGDSISCPTRRIATKLSGEEILFDGLGTSKAVDNPYFAESIRLFSRQQKNRDIIILNNGLHGWHLSDSTEYKFHYEELVKFLMEEFKDTPLALVLTTCVPGERNERVIARNNSVKEIAQKYQLPIIDLFSVSVENLHLQIQGDAHWTEEGYHKLAEKILAAVWEICR